MSPSPPPPTGPSPAAVSFDAAGTLIRLAEPVGTTYSRVASRHGVSASPEATARAFAAVWKRTAPAFAPGQEDDPHERAWWSRLVRAVFAEAGAPFPDEGAFAAFFDELYEHYESPGTWIPVPGAAEVLDRVARHHRCVVLSNFDGRLRRILGDLGLRDPFEHFFLSCEQRFSKPDPRLFARVAETLGLPPASILHVGDDPVCDWAGAEAAGFGLYRVQPGPLPLDGLLRQLSLA